MQAKFDQEQKDQVRLQKELKKWEGKKLDLQKGLESEKKFCNQLEVEVKPRGWRNMEKRPTLTFFFSEPCLTPSLLVPS